MATCANHPTKMATARCKCCGKPVCAECKVVGDGGIFCSPECQVKTRAFTQRVGDGKVRRKTRFFGKQMIGGLFLLLIMGGGAAAFLHFAMGVDSLDDLKALLNKWWEARHLLF